VKSLGDLKRGQTGTIVEIAENQSLSQRLMALGLMPGVTVTVTQVAPLGDPITVKFGFSTLSLRRAEASVISIDSVQSGSVA
jgi:ferrous iron transport protein A